MSTGCITLGRALLLKTVMHQGEDLEQLTLIEDSRVIATENSVYEALAAQATPFVTTLSEATCHVGALHTSTKGCPPFVRLSASQQTSGFGWRECKAAFDEARLVENRVERLVCDADPGAAEKRILQRLAASRLEVVAPKSRGSGDAQFEAISIALWGTAVYAPLLRQAAVSYMRANPEEYVGFLGDSFDAYLRAMARPGVAGDELTMRAVADHFGVVINLVTADSFMWFLRYAPRQTRSGREVFLAHVAPYVYLPIRRRSPMTMLRLNLSWSSEKNMAQRAQQAAQQQQEQQEQQQQLPPQTPERAPRSLSAPVL